LGTTYHESGTLWMGDEPASSVTDTVGRFHHVANAYACDQSILPTVGSANPVLTGLTLAKRVAESLPI
jgi:choline dehydrogenase-like flavoprotein